MGLTEQGHILAESGAELDRALAEDRACSRFAYICVDNG
jgi:hypothetical protein